MNFLIEIFEEGKNLDSLQMAMRAVAVFIATLIFIRISGRRSFGQRSGVQGCAVSVNAESEGRFRGGTGASALRACGTRLAVYQFIRQETEMKMETSPKERNPAAGKSEEDVDKGIEDSFPASDPPVTGGTARIESEDGEEVDEDADGDAPEQ